MDDRIREGIEACRTGSDDLLESGMADVARVVGTDAEVRRELERIQRWDVLISAEMEQIPVPEGLAARILDRIHAQGSGSAHSGTLLGAVVHSAEAAEANTDAQVELAPSPSIWQRRYWAGASLSAIATAVLVVALGYWLQMGTDLPLDQLAAIWHQELNDDWQHPDRAPAKFAMPPVVRVPATRWQWIHRYTPTEVVAYELRQGDTTAMLYVTKMHRDGLRSVPPGSPHTDAAGQAVGCWQSSDGKTVFVLVVPNVRSYRTFVRPSSAPLAILTLPTDVFRRPVGICGMTRKIA